MQKMEDLKEKLSMFKDEYWALEFKDKRNSKEDDRLETLSFMILALESVINFQPEPKNSIVIWCDENGLHNRYQYPDLDVYQELKTWQEMKKAILDYEEKGGKFYYVSNEDLIVF